MKYYLPIVFILIFSCDEPLQPEPDPSLVLSFQSTAITTNDTLDVSLNLNDNIVPIFGIYVKIDYDSSLLSFSDAAGFVAGNYFGGNNITFVKEENGSIFLSSEIVFIGRLVWCKVLF